MTRKKSPQEIEINRLFGQSLKQARKQLKINQTVAARRIGVELVTYQSYEQGRRFPSNETLEAICNALKCGCLISSTLHGVIFMPFPPQSH